MDQQLNNLTEIHVRLFFSFLLFLFFENMFFCKGCSQLKAARTSLALLFLMKNENIKCKILQIVYDYITKKTRLSSQKDGIKYRLNVKAC